MDLKYELYEFCFPAFCRDCNKEIPVLKLCFMLPNVIVTHGHKGDNYARVFHCQECAIPYWIFRTVSLAPFGARRELPKNLWLIVLEYMGDYSNTTVSVGNFDAMEEIILEDDARAFLKRKTNEYLKSLKT